MPYQERALGFSTLPVRDDCALNGAYDQDPGNCGHVPAQLKQLRSCNNSSASAEVHRLATKINLLFSWASVAKLSDVGPQLTPVAIAQPHGPRYLLRYGSKSMSQRYVK